MDRGDCIQRRLLPVLAQHDQNVIWEVQRLLQLDRSRLRIASQVLREAQLVILLDHLFHDGPSPAHELLKVEGVILAFLFSLNIAYIFLVIALVGDHDVVGGLVPFVDCAQIFCLRFLLHVFKAGLDQGKFVRASKQLLVINVVFSPRYHLENIEEFFLAQLNKLSQLLCAIFLRVRRLVVDSRPGHQDSLLSERFQILLVL